MFPPVWSVYIRTVLHHPATEGRFTRAAEMDSTKLRMIAFWGTCHVPYQMTWTVMLEVTTGPMWYLSRTNSDDPSNFLESPIMASEELDLARRGHGRHASAGLITARRVIAAAAQAAVAGREHGAALLRRIAVAES